MNSVGLANIGFTSLGQAKVSHFAFLHQVGHGAYRIFDRHLRIDAVLVEQVDIVGAKAPQRGVGGFFHVLRTAIDSVHCPS